MVRVINFNKLRRKVRIDRVCQLLGIELKRNGNTMRGSCPICHNGSNRCFTITLDKGLWYCFGGCRHGGDSIQLYAEAKKVSTYQAACELQKTFEPPR